MKDHFNVIVPEGLIDEETLKRIVLGGLMACGAIFKPEDVDVVLADTFDSSKE